MRTHHDEGLGGSIGLYAIALFGALTLLMLPVYWLNAGTKLENPGLAAYVPPPGTTLIRGQDPNVMQFAVLDRTSIVDAGALAALNAKSKAAEKPKRASIARNDDAEPRERTAPVRERVVERRGLFPFSLF